MRKGERKGGKGKKKVEKEKKVEQESCLLPFSGRAGFASLVFTELNEERLSHSRELNNFKIRGSAGQKAPL